MSDTSEESETASDDEATRSYLRQVRREIDDEVRRRRAAGDFPPSFERKLDELFSRFTPTGTADDHFTESLKLADRSAYFDIDVPTGSRRRPRGFVKWSLWQAEAWFVRYVVTQMNHFAASTMRVLHLLDERVAEIELQMQTMTPPSLPDDEVVAAAPDPLVFGDGIVGLLRAPESPSGRVLHAECGDGRLLELLKDAGFDAYGIDPGTSGSDQAVRAGLDVRRDDVLGHLGSVADEALAGLVLSGAVDRLSLAERRRILRLAELKLATGGILVVLSTSPESWEPTVGAIVADLAPGRPLHLETWTYLIGQLGFADISSNAGPPSGGRAGNPPASFAVLARKRAGPLVAEATRARPDSR